MAIKYPKVPRPNSLPPMDLTHRVELQVERATPGYFDDNGRYVDGVRSIITVTANVQPANGHDLKIFPESDRSEDWIKIYSIGRLDTLYEGSGVEADIVIWEGKRYMVKTAKTYRMGVLDHTKALAVRLPVINGGVYA